MKTKTLLFTILALLSFSCVNTEIENSAVEISDLKYSTIEIAKAKGDSMSIVTESYQDYVFIKKDGKLILHKKYISNENWVDMPAAVLIVLVIVAFTVGLATGTLLKK